MKMVNMHEAKTHLSRLVDLALAGEEIVIARRKTPLVRLAIVAQSPARRKIGEFPNLVRRMDENFNDSLDDWTEEIVPEISNVRDGNENS